MAKYIVKRLLLMIPVLIGVSFIVFGIMSFTPGDPASAILGTSATKEQIAKLNNELGMNDPFLVRYLRYVGGAIHGDFGTSYRTRKAVFGEIFSRFGTTFRIDVFAIWLAVLIGVPIGVISAVKQYSGVDFVSTIMAMFFASVPQFWLAMMFVMVFSLKLGLLPSTFTGTITLKHYIMPVITLAMATAASILRLTRSNMLETIRQDYVRTARAKGASERKVIYKHALRNALLPVITVVGNEFGYLLGGTVIVEAIFGIPGLGSLTITSIRAKDIPQTTACILFLSLLNVVIVLVVDILYAYIDPRIKAKYVGGVKRAAKCPAKI
jgi:peptide/nickel transport system permease protein